VSDSELITKAVGIMQRTKRASSAAFRRRLGLSQLKTMWLMDELERREFIGPPTGEARAILFEGVETCR